MEIGIPLAIVTDMGGITCHESSNNYSAINTESNKLKMNVMRLIWS